MLRPVSEVADTAARLGPAGRYDPVVQHSGRHYAGFIRDLVKTGSVGFVETGVKHVGLFDVAKQAAALRFIIDARASNRHFFESSILTVAHKRGTLPCQISGSAWGRSKLVCRFSRY